MNASELKKAIEEYSQALSFLRDTELGDDVISKNKAQKINDNLDDLEATIRRQRLPMGFTTKESEDEKFQSQYKDAFLKYIRKGIESDLINLANSNNSMENLLKCDSNGFAITSSMNSIIANSMYKNSPIRQLARIVNISNDSLDVAAYTTDIAASWGDERTVAPETDAFTRKTIKVHELTAQPKMTQKMIDDDQVDHESWLAELLSDILLAQEDNAFFNGDGVNKPVGILMTSYGMADKSTHIDICLCQQGQSFHHIMDFYSYNSDLVVNHRNDELQRPDGHEVILAEALTIAKNNQLTLVYAHRDELMSRAGSFGCLYGCPVSSELEKKYAHAGQHSELIPLNE